MDELIVSFTSKVFNLKVPVINSLNDVVVVVVVVVSFSSTTDYPYTVTHIVTDNYSYFGNTISNNGENYSRTVFGKVVLSYDGRDNMTIDCDGHQKSYKKVSETLQFVSLVNSGCTTQNYSLKNTTTSTDIFSVKSDSIITQIVLHDNGTILRIYTNDWERQ